MLPLGSLGVHGAGEGGDGFLNGSENGGRSNVHSNANYSFIERNMLNGSG